MDTNDTEHIIIRIYKIFQKHTAYLESIEKTEVTINFVGFTSRGPYVFMWDISIKGQI